MTWLECLQLSHNQFEGMISPTISNSPSLIILDIRNNYLSGNIPKWLYDHHLLVAILLSGNRFEGHLHRRMCQMKSLHVFDISDNHISGGIIPSEMGELSELRSLNLSNNFLTGPIPNSFQNLKNVESLDLSHNKLSGGIPYELFSTFGTQSYDGNPDLCGDPIPRNCSTTNQLEPRQEDENEETRIIDSPLFFYAFVAVSYAFGFWIFFGILIIKKNWRVIYFRAVDKFIESCFEMLSKYR
ncbi:hypothetical protein SLA2020_369410 [Shorea laevis]